MAQGSRTAPGRGDPTVWNVTVAALQKALALENRPNEFAKITTQLEELAEGTLRFAMPIYPQKAQLDIFVQRSINSFPHFFNSCPDDIDLIHHLQRYAACYVAYKTGYFYHTAIGGNTTKGPRIKILPPKFRPPTGTVSARESAGRPEFVGGASENGQTAIEAFLPGVSRQCRGFWKVFTRLGLQEKFICRSWLVNLKTT
ncbi:hypothetical protein B0H14DRAFT_1116103 [Mycena olivaceomarginata]|nr:hypothetical protein B0H14DRAFT_1116103 [Mycena olivaceomarginata]